jgi:hypothetical protein
VTARFTKGKARTELVRSRDLKAVPAVAERPDSRDVHGRFAAGNAGGKGRGWKRAIAKMLGRTDAELAGVATALAADAWRIFTVSMREMPQDGPNVRALVARKARHEALEGYWTARALEGLGTPEGDQAEARATQHGVRAERLTVTALDVATRLATRRPTRPAWLVAPQIGVRTGEETRVSSARVVKDAVQNALDPADDDSDEPSAASPTSPPAPRPARLPPPVRPPTPAAPAAPPPAPAVGLCIHRAHPTACPTCLGSRAPATPHGAPWRSLLPKGAR